jgi:hypothetical protein
MTLIGRRFGLSIERGSGIFCDESGLFVGGVPMLERSKGSDGAVQWRPRAADELNRDLSKRYGVPIEIHSNWNASRPSPEHLDVVMLCLQ